MEYVRYEILEDDGVKARVRLSGAGRPDFETWAESKLAHQVHETLGAGNKTAEEARDAIWLLRRSRQGATMADRLNYALSLPKIAPGMAWVNDAYGLRSTVRKARHFRLDAPASRHIATASVAIAGHMDEARELARAPYPIVWVDVANVPFLARIQELGLELTRIAAGRSRDGAPVDSRGWLIERHQTQHSAHRATYFVETREGFLMFPLAYTWDCDGRECPWDMEARLSEAQLRASTKDFLTGVVDVKCSAIWATSGWCDNKSKNALPFGVAQEAAGELRHIFAFLMTIGHVPTEEREIIRQDVDVSQPPPVVKGKPVYPLVHRDIVIRLPKHRDIAKVITRVCEGMRKRRHEVRGHWRYYYNEDGSVRRRVWVREHERGDESLGRVVRSVEKSLGYRVST